jgi:hypothetical protein
LLVVVAVVHIPGTLGFLPRGVVLAVIGLTRELLAGVQVPRARLPVWELFLLLWVLVVLVAQTGPA